MGFGVISAAGCCSLAEAMGTGYLLRTKVVAPSRKKKWLVSALDAIIELRPLKTFCRLLVPLEIQGAFSCTASIEDDTWQCDEHDYHSTVLEINGTERSRAKQCSRIVDLLQKRAQYQGGEALGLEVIIAEDQVGPLIGAGSKNLDLMMRMTETEIQVSEPMQIDRSVSERVFSITGSTENVVVAQQMISDMSSRRWNPYVEAMNRDGPWHYESTSPDRKSQGTKKKDIYRGSEKLLNPQDVFGGMPPGKVLSPSDREEAESFEDEPQELVERMMKISLNDKPATSKEMNSGEKHLEQQGAHYSKSEILNYPGSSSLGKQQVLTYPENMKLLFNHDFLRESPPKTGHGEVANGVLEDNNSQNEEDVKIDESSTSGKEQTLPEKKI